jgi:hypothetical protein
MSKKILSDVLGATNLSGTEIGDNRQELLSATAITVPWLESEHITETVMICVGLTRGFRSP